MAPTQLDDFLNTPANMHAREAILMHRFFYEVKLSAARNGYYLNTYFDDVDHDGFDVIFDDQDRIKKIQVKTVNANSKTTQWKIHKKILKPSIHNIDNLAFESSVNGEGTEGGVVLIEFEDSDNGLNVTYYYTDVFVLMAFDCDIIKHSRKNKITAVDNCIQKLIQGSNSELLPVPKSAFLKCNDVDSLLALMGIHSCKYGGWIHPVTIIANHTRSYSSKTMALPCPLENLIKQANKEILALASLT